MDRSDIIILIDNTYTYDDIGQEIASETEREVFCDMSSISRAEWYDAGQNSMKPEYKVTMFDPDYNGEEIAEYNGKRYVIYRTYRGKNETIELYLQRETGV